MKCTVSSWSGANRAPDNSLGASASGAFSHIIDRELNCAKQERCNKIGDRAGAKRAYERQRAAVMAMLDAEVGA